MRKCVLLFIILILSTAAFTGCRGDTSASQESAQSEIVNPVVSYDSVSKLNAALGFDMIELDPEFGFTAYEYDAIDKRLGQIEYTDIVAVPTESEQASLIPQSTSEVVSNKHITLRMAPGDDDITGISGVEYEIEDFNGIDVNVGVYENTVYIGNWIYEDYSYSVAAYNIESGTADAIIDSLTAHILGIDTQTEKD